MDHPGKSVGRKESKDEEALQSAKWEAYLLVKEMVKATEESIQGLEVTVQAIHKDLYSMKDALQGISTTSLHIMHDMAHLHCRLGHCSNRVANELTCASSNLVGNQNFRSKRRASLRGSVLLVQVGMWSGFGCLY
eukprot:Gb_05003 [translate_table: standard]